MLKKATSLGIIANPVRLDQFVSSAAESLQVDDTLDRGQVLELHKVLAEPLAAFNKRRTKVAQVRHRPAKGGQPQR